MTLQEQLKSIEKITSKKKKGYFMYINERWAEEYPLSDEELRTGKASEYRIMKYLFPGIIEAELLFQKLNSDWCMDELISTYDEENDCYEDIYQHFIVRMEYDEDTTVRALKRANCGLYLFYDNDTDQHFLGVGDCGMSRTLILSDVYLTTNYDKVNLLEKERNE